MQESSWGRARTLSAKQLPKSTLHSVDSLLSRLTLHDTNRPNLERSQCHVMLNESNSWKVITSFHKIWIETTPSFIGATLVCIESALDDKTDWEEAAGEQEEMNERDGIQVNIWRLIYLNCGEWYEDVIDHRSYKKKTIIRRFLCEAFNFQFIHGNINSKTCRVRVQCMSIWSCSFTNLLSGLMDEYIN